MGNLVFATGGTTGKSKIICHDWLHYEFVIQEAARRLRSLFSDSSVNSVANCLTSGNLWGGFLFAHEICRNLRLNYYPFASVTESDDLCSAIREYQIDTLFCMPSFAEKLITVRRIGALISLKNIFYLGEAFQPESLKKINEMLPGIRIKSLAYSTQETGPLGFQCSHLHDDVYHVYDHVRLNLNENKEEIIASVTYPDDQDLLNHPTGDTGILVPKQVCPCGFTGMNLILTGRLASHYNIMGTSISVHEFTEALSQYSENNVSITDVQIVIVNQYERGIGLVLLADKRLSLSKEKLDTAFRASPLIRKIISDTVFFHVLLADRTIFIRSRTSGKVKCFAVTDRYPGGFEGSNGFVEALLKY